MYANVSRSGSSSTAATGTPQKAAEQQTGTKVASSTPAAAAGSQPAGLSLPGSADVDRPSTRRGGRPGSQSQSGGSAEGVGQQNGGGNNDDDQQQQQPRNSADGQSHVDVWTRRRSEASHRRRSSAAGTPNSNSASSTSGSGSANGGGGSSSGQPRKGSYPELSEPDHYNSDHFDEESEGSGHSDQPADQGGDDLSKKLRDLASTRTRSLHESLQSAIQRGAASINGISSSSAAAVAEEPSLPPPVASRRSSRSSAATGQTETKQGRSNGSNDGSNGQSEANGSAANGSSKQSSAGSGRTETRGSPAGNKALYSLANGTLVNALRSHDEAKIEEEEHLMPQLLAENKRPAAGQEVAKRAAPVPAQRTHSQLGGGQQSHHRFAAAVSPGGQLPVSQGKSAEARSARAVKEEAISSKIPLGFGSSSARNCLVSASGRPRPNSSKKPGGGDGANRQRSASVSAIRDEGAPSSPYKAWLRQKLADQRIRKEREAALKAAEEQKKKEKRELAERNFTHWKSEMERRSASQKEREKRKAEQKAQKERREKEQKKADAEKTFEFWRQSREQAKSQQQRRSHSAEQRRREAEERKREQKRQEAEAAFHAWIQEADDRKRTREERELEEAARKQQLSEEQSGMRKQIADEAYGLWLAMKEEERKYRGSLAFRILDFEQRANSQQQRASPWKPISPTSVLHPRVRQPPPELAQGRRRTLEPRLVLPHSKPQVRSASQSAKSSHRSVGAGGVGTRAGQTKSADKRDRRPWR